jgi:hypothetical protein
MLHLFPSFRPAEKARVTPVLVNEQISAPSVQYTLPANLALEFSAADPGSGAFVTLRSGIRDGKNPVGFS